MTSERKIRANRANARASTGPKTARGRARSARNALRHGLSLSIYSDPISAEVDVLARQIGPAANTETAALERQVAEAQLDVRRVRNARHQLLSQAMSDPDYDSAASIRKKLAFLIRGSFVAGPLTPTPDDVREVLDSKPEEPVKFATILLDRARQLLALERYERRALSRRKLAIRALDKAKKRLLVASATKLRS